MLSWTSSVPSDEHLWSFLYDFMSHKGRCLSLKGKENSDLLAQKLQMLWFTGSQSQTGLSNWTELNIIFNSPSNYSLYLVKSNNGLTYHLAKLIPRLKLLKLNLGRAQHLPQNPSIIPSYSNIVNAIIRMFYSSS